ncbi:hypothetical protein SUDANB1_05704 [Streptomyces sp. enrichment culture]|uniref:DUF6302 family protein n=1 Tax=Streptomyces sp. enrichment culture TaxID=1795815 RepID=UPI003F56D3A2
MSSAVEGPAEVRRPDSREEWEASWYRERLAEPSLLNTAVAIVVGGTSYLAVPVGGERRGGYIPVRDPTSVMLLRQALEGLDGFPAVRVRWSTHPDTCDVVEWGDCAPDADGDAERGRFYGYSERAIARFTKERHMISKQSKRTRGADDQPAQYVSVDLRVFGVRLWADGHTGLEAWRVLYRQSPWMAVGVAGYVALLVGTLVMLGVAIGSEVFG